MSSCTFGTTPYLTNDELSALRERRLVLDCMRMKLGPLSNSGRLFSGPGNIKQRASGELEFTLYDNETVSSHQLAHALDEINDVTVGKILGDSRLFQLSATDLSGREWNASHILPSIQWFEGGVLCAGKLQEITFVTNPPSPTKREYLHLEIDGDLKIPANTRTVIKKTIGDRQAGTSLRFNVLEIENGEYQYSFQNENGNLQVYAIAKDQQLPDSFEIRLVEALQFVVARPINWLLLEKRTPDCWETRIRTTRKNEARSRIGAPIAAHEDSGLWFRTLFEKYMAFSLAQQSGDRMHPISAWILAIYHASLGAIETQALVLSIAIEAILQYVHRSGYELSSEERDWIEKAKEYFANWEGPSKLGERAIGLLAMLNSPNASFRLTELVSIGAITNQQRQAWRKLRNKVAHGETLGSSSLQEFLDLTNEVLVMFYHLVFLHHRLYREIH